MPWQIDPMHTQVEFAVKHFGMMTVRGHFREVQANGDIDPNNPEASNLEVTIEAASLTTNNPHRDNDLRGVPGDFTRGSADARTIFAIVSRIAPRSSSVRVRAAMRVTVGSTARR